MLLTGHGANCAHGTSARNSHLGTHASKPRFRIALQGVKAILRRSAMRGPNDVT